VNASSFPQFREAFDQLSQFRFYNLNPSSLRDLQKPSAITVLNRDGSNITTVLTNLKQYFPDVKALIEEYLESIVPDIRGVDVANLGPVQTLEFKQGVSGSSYPWKFFASNMSDGTLRAFGILVALFQKSNDTSLAIPLIGLEEPEVSLHPAAMRLIFESIVEGSASRQVIVTSHSTDLLDNSELSTDAIRAVISRQGATSIAIVNPAARKTLKDRLYSAGELLRLDQLAPDEDAIQQQNSQIDLFSQFSSSV
jgi:predicted ATPase